MNSAVTGSEAVTEGQRCGYVAIVGRPNVGKSTLLNHILGQKLSITSRRPQTTRHQVLGIKTEDNVQTIFVDTPGMHKVEKKAINRYMNRAASSALTGVDAVVFVVDRLTWTEEDQLVLTKLSHAKCPIILVLNKVDRLKERKEELMQFMQEVSDKADFKAIIPVSALHGHNLKELEKLIADLMPESIHFFPEDQITDRSSRFMAAELIREKIMRQLGDELPYEMTVEIEEFKQEMRPKGPLLVISGLILVERSSQKAIVIGDKGARLRQIGQEARIDMEKMFDSKVMLNLWVKVRGGWSDDDRALKSLGYDFD
ncbi:GTPase Era [Endozoicomonas sp. 8E]|uniref:GTPase Era n=1 Tax=Endozoicomonas sp. 8E TaxID=3035692 RepID=UPI002938D74B|nr:GTPase Era [Endozoicomonas sp. 8E]WOG25561.1 GTPase Era [Endozoicomonas sp. 8E]